LGLAVLSTAALASNANVPFAAAFAQATALEGDADGTLGLSEHAVFPASIRAKRRAEGKRKEENK
jgi:hypothetical protein